MSETNFQPIFDYIDKSLKTHKEEILAELPSKANIETLQNSVDVLANRFDKIESSSIITNAKVEKIEHWLIDASKNIGLPYKA